MSANNIIVINLKELTITYKDVEHEDWFYLKRKFNSIKSLLTYAKNLQNEERPEYNIFLT